MDVGLASDLLIIAPYREQARLIQQQLRILLRMLNLIRRADKQLTRADVPLVNAFDSYQLQNKSFVLHEYTVSQANESKGPGSPSGRSENEYGMHAS